MCPEFPHASTSPFFQKGSKSFQNKNNGAEILGIPLSRLTSLSELFSEIESLLLLHGT
jgi:hypothetical protein